MSVVQKLNENKSVGIGVAAALVVVALGIIGFQLIGGRTNAAAGDMPTQSFYTDDDGKTFFKDSIDRIPPFDHNGKKAFRADVFKGSDGKEFVGIVYRYTDAGRREMEAYLPNKSDDDDGVARQSIDSRSLQFKKAGAPDSAWQPYDDVSVDRIRASIKNPSGQPAQLVTP